MPVKSDFTSKDTSLWSSGICTVLIASMKLSVDCGLCSDSLVSHARMLVKCLDYHFTLKMASAQVVETSVTNNSSSQDSDHQDDLFQSRYPGFKPFS